MRGCSSEFFMIFRSDCLSTIGNNFYLFFIANFIIEFMSQDSPNISTAIIAFVRFEKFFLIESREIVKVFGSTSAKTGIAFQCKTAAAQAVIVNVGNIISSPGSMSIAPTQQVSPELQELTAATYLTLKYSDQFFSNLLTFLPP